ncbi:hypothetical protein GCM10009118_23930 [Wandonia haliotis]|uniref:Lipoprotein n=1 Tax=Wandonia haliotis TaxID=574963 RepID=A0ABN1MRN6_9FLAO
MSRWFTYLLISLFLFSCTKKETLRVSVVNVVTGEPVVGNTISIVEIFNVSDGVSGSKTKDFYSGQTNSEGVLYVTEKFNENRRYEVFVGQFPEEHCYLNRMGYTWSVGEATDLAFEYAPCAYLKLKIENVNCLSEEDEIFYRRFWLSGGESTNGVSQYGCFSYIGNYFDVPMGEYRYEWEVTRNGVTNYYDTAFSINAGGYYDLEINY